MKFDEVESLVIFTFDPSFILNLRGKSSNSKKERGKRKPKHSNIKVEDASLQANFKI